MKHLKTILIAAVMLIMAFSFAACTETGNTPNTGNNNETIIGGNDTDNGDKDSPDNGENETPDISDDAVLVVYFSCTNNTKSVAEKISIAANARLYEITPEQPYTSEDINYHNSSCRAVVEQGNRAARPAISGSIEDFTKYDVVFIGYPIWGNDAPRIIYTFLDSYDFSGKTLVPFCTSGGSGIGGSERNLKAYKSDVTWVGGREFSRSTAQASITAWVNNLGY